jgi:hypothetical protein
MNSARRILKTPRSTINALTRQIDIQTSQPLRNIAERRCLLNALQKFGEVATFLPKVSLSSIKFQNQMGGRDRADKEL